MAVRVDQPDDGDTVPSRADAPEAHDAATSETPRTRPEAPTGPGDSTTRTERALENRAEVDGVYRAYAIDRAYERVCEIEKNTVTPAMRRIEAEDPDRRLAGLEHRLKGKDRLTEKVSEAVEERGHSVEEALGMVKDAIRYTFCYSEDRYTAGVYADCGRLADAGFERFDRRNSWEHDEYKGINSRWRTPDSGQLFEVQFHTETSLAAKEETHDAYKQLRTLRKDDTEVGRFRAYQREVTAKVPVPPGAADIPDYRQERAMPEKITYYAIVDDLSTRERPAGVLRRIVHDDGEHDEAFTRNLEWKRSASLYSYERGNADAEFFEISEEKANRIVDRIRRSMTGEG